MSYSDVVKEMQGDKEKAIKRIIEIANAQEDSFNSINELHKQIDTIQSIINIRKQELKHITSHIKQYPPFKIVEKDFIYFLNNDFSVEIQQADYLL